jgi:putative membrane protein
MKKWMLASGVCALIAAACSKDNGSQDSNNVDMNFVNMASISNNAEIMAGQLAATKGTSALVKTYGQQMVNEHTLAQQDLAERARRANLMAHDSVDAAHRALMARLNGLSGRTFDTAYINSQVADHAKTIDLFNTEISGGQNVQIRSYATDYLPHIQMHYTRADSIRKVL